MSRQTQPIPWSRSTGMLGARATLVVSLVLAGMAAGAAALLGFAGEIPRGLVIAATVVGGIVAAVGSTLGVAIGRRRIAKGDDTDAPEPPIRRIRPDGMPSIAVLAALGAMAVGAAGFASCATVGTLTPSDQRYADAGVATLGVGCGVLVSEWCAPGEELVPAAVCRWLVPGCVGVHGAATLYVDAARSTRPTEAKAYVVAAARAPVPVMLLVDWVVDCEGDPERPMCAEVLAAWDSGEDFVIVARE